MSYFFSSSRAWKISMSLRCTVTSLLPVTVFMSCCVSVEPPKLSSPPVSSVNMAPTVLYQSTPLCV